MTGYNTTVIVNLSELRERLARQDHVQRSYGELHQWLRGHGMMFMPDGTWLCDGRALKHLEPAEVTFYRRLGPLQLARRTPGPWYRGAVIVLAILLNLVLVVRSILLFSVYLFTEWHIDPNPHPYLLAVASAMVLLLGLANVYVLIRGLPSALSHKILFVVMNGLLVLLGVLATDLMVTRSLPDTAGFLRMPINLAYLAMAAVPAGMTFAILRHDFEGTA